MKVAPYFCTPQKKKKDRARWRKGEKTRTRNTIKRETAVKEEECREKEEMNERQRDHLKGTEGKD